MHAELNAKDHHMRSLEADKATLLEKIASLEFQVATLTTRNGELVADKAATERAHREERREESRTWGGCRGGTRIESQAHGERVDAMARSPRAHAASPDLLISSLALSPGSASPAWTS